MDINWRKHLQTSRARVNDFLTYFYKWVDLIQLAYQKFFKPTTIINLIKGIFKKIECFSDPEVVFNMLNIKTA